MPQQTYTPPPQPEFQENLSDEELEKRYYEQREKEQLQTQMEQINATIDLLNQKQKNIEAQLRNTQNLTLNPNLNEIDFDLVNTTNHVLIDLTLTKKQQEAMEPQASGPPKYTYEK